MNETQRICTDESDVADGETDDEHCVAGGTGDEHCVAGEDSVEDVDCCIGLLEIDSVKGGAPPAKKYPAHAQCLQSGGQSIKPQQQIVKRDIWKLVRCCSCCTPC